MIRRERVSRLNANVARAPGACSARSPRTTRASPARRAAWTRRSAAARPRRRQRRRHVVLAPAQASEIASSIASLVPEPIEKCAVCAASPSSTTFSWRQDALRTVTKLIQRVRFSISRRSRRRTASSQACLVEPRAVVVSTMNVLARVAVGIARGPARTPCGVSAMRNVKASKTWSVPNQAYVARRAVQRRLEGRSAARSVLLTPSAATTRSPSSVGHLGAGSAASTPSAAARRCRRSQQLLAPHGREPVAAARDHLAPVVHVDLAPAHEAARDLRVALRVGRLERRQRLVARRRRRSRTCRRARCARSTTTSCAGSRRLSRIERYSPPGPPPAIAIRMAATIALLSTIVIDIAMCPVPAAHVLRRVPARLGGWIAVADLIALMADTRRSTPRSVRSLACSRAASATALIAPEQPRRRRPATG